MATDMKNTTLPNIPIGGWVAAQLEACVRCGICAGACPFYAVLGTPQVSPVWKMELLQRLYRQRHSLVGRIAAVLGLEKRLTPADLAAWQEYNFSACSTCNRCSIACPMGIAVGQLLHQVRDILAEQGTVPENLLKMKASVQAEKNVFGYPAYERSGWVEYMDAAPPDLYMRPQAEIVYFVGCVTSFAPRTQRIAEAFVQLLDAAVASFTILGEGESCCGFPLRSAGMLAEAQALIQANAAAVQAAGARTVVFTCPACRLMWLEEYARLLPGVRLLHASELLEELIEAGRIELQPVAHSFTYHDPCDLARTGGVYDPPRRVLQAIPGLRLVEISERRENGLCCGGGGDVEMVAPHNVRAVAQQTVGKLKATGAERLATACPQCLRVLEQAGEGWPALDIVEIVARSAGLLAE